MKYLFPLCFLLASCSQSWLCRKCLQGGNVIHDTLTFRDTIRTPGEEAHASFDKKPIDWDSLRNANPDMFPESLPCPELPPVMEVNKGKAHGRIKQTEKGLDLTVKCDPDTVYIERKISIPVKIETGTPPFRVGLFVLLALLAGGLLVKIFGR